jgi:hypothetical protein
MDMNCRVLINQPKAVTAFYDRFISPSERKNDKWDRILATLRKDPTSINPGSTRP